jgi:hypothetical protein
MASNPQLDKVAEVKRAIRAWSDLKDIIVILSRHNAGDGVDEPKLKTREGNHLYHALLAPMYGLPTSSGAPDISRLDDDVQQGVVSQTYVGQQKGRIYSSQDLAITADTPSGEEISHEVIHCATLFASGKLLPTHPAYDALCNIVNAHAWLLEEKTLAHNNAVEIAYQRRKSEESP